MTDASGNGGNANAGVPTLNALAQYTKDFSFENPNAPRSLAPQESAPNISIHVNVDAQQLSPTDFEVLLTVDCSAGEGAELLFKLELKYAGIFRLMNIPQEQIHPVVMIECPRLLFPFVRQMVGDATRNGGYPPLYIDPIDFLSLYQQKLAQQGGGPANFTAN